MINLVTKIKNKIISLMSEVHDVQISDLRHYCGFKYGCNTFNPYENFIVGLHSGVHLDTLKQNFNNFLISYRPENLGEALGINLSKKYPLRCYPWTSNCTLGNGWVSKPESVTDVMTYFCDLGIPFTLVEQEYFWHQRAYSNIKDIGYQPKKYGYIQLIEISVKNKKSFIVLDGNHRVSALSALGFKSVCAKINKSHIYNIQNVHLFPQVAQMAMPENDAIRIMQKYIDGVTDRPIIGKPSRIC
jgi:hypothetical protein